MKHKSYIFQIPLHNFRWRFSQLLQYFCVSKCPEILFYNYFYFFSCPGQLTRWPCHSLTQWLIFWFNDYNDYQCIQLIEVPYAQCKASVLVTFLVILWDWTYDFGAVGHPLNQCALRSSLKVWWNSRNSRNSRPKLIHCFSPQLLTFLSSLVVMGYTCWRKGQRFNTRGWAKSWHAQLFCKERKVHRKPWFVSTGVGIIPGYQRWWWNNIHFCECRLL